MGYLYFYFYLYLRLKSGPQRQWLLGFVSMVREQNGSKKRHSHMHTYTNFARGVVTRVRIHIRSHDVLHCTHYVSCRIRRLRANEDLRWLCAVRSPDSELCSAGARTQKRLFPASVLDLGTYRRSSCLVLRCCESLLPVKRLMWRLTSEAW